ncbi:MAG: hypothetical protein JW959_03810 [Pirellulales bacterium]|nr:hypothetical protein [Pirellulales bacterium]
MRRTIPAFVAPLLGLVLCFLFAEAASAARPHGWCYPGYAPAVVAGYGYAVGYAATPYGYVYNPRRAYRQTVRYGFAPLPAVMPVAVYGYPYPYYGYFSQPYSSTRGPRDYFYSQDYDQSHRRQSSVPPDRQPRPVPADSGPEVIPAPPSQPTPR